MGEEGMSNFQHMNTGNMTGMQSGYSGEGRAVENVQNKHIETLARSVFTVDPREQIQNLVFLNDYNMLIGFVLATLLPSGVFGFGKTVYIGGLFEENSLADKAFRISIVSLNSHRHADKDMPRQFIQSQPVTTVNNDSYDISRTVCDLANKGIAAIFGPQHEITSRTVKSMCDMMEIPHVAARWDSHEIRRNGLINMYPHSHTLFTVYLQLAVIYKWETFTIIYETTDNLARMNQLLKRWSSNGHTVIVRQLPEGPDYREIFNEMKSSGERNIVLDCSVDVLPEVLKQAQQVGVMSDEHSYIIATLDLQTINLEPYQYGGTNFTGLRLIDPEDPVVIKAFGRAELDWGLDDPSQITVEAALIYDGVQLFGRALKQLDDAIVADVKTSLCENLSSWEHGSSLLNFMRLTEFRGLTGLIKFDPAGYRSNLKLDLISLDKNGVKKIGVWNSTSGIEFIPARVSSEHQAELDLRNRTFIVLICLTSPYGMLKESAKTEIGNDRYEGFGIDIIQELSKRLGFNYTFLEHDSTYGSKDPITKEWNGMIREIMEDRADLAITDLTITAERQEAVDFTMPFMNLGISILFTKPVPAGSELFSFLSPFSSELWMYLIGSYTLVSLLLFILGRLSPAEWNNPYPCIEEPEELENQFSFKNAFWSNLGFIMQQGSELAPTALSTRMLMSSWSFFCLLIVPSYTANLAAFLLTVSKEVLIKNAADLSNNPHGIKYGAKSSGSTIDFFEKSTDPIYAKMYKYMMEHKDEVLMESNELGVEKVLKGKYAYFMESSTIDYEAERKCDLMQVGNLLDFKGYGIAMKKHSPHRQALSTTLLKLQETGFLTDLEKKWWTQKRGGGSCEEKESTLAANPLGTDNVGGVFVVLMVGTALSGIYTAWALIWEVCCASAKKKVSFKDEIKEELRFVFKCGATTKPVRR